MNKTIDNQEKSSAGQPSAGQPSAGQPSAGQPSVDILKYKKSVDISKYKKDDNLINYGYFSLVLAGIATISPLMIDSLFVQQWIYPLTGILLSILGVFFSTKSYQQAKLAAYAARAAQNAAIKAQQALTVHRELLPQIEQLDKLMKNFIEELTSNPSNNKINMINDITDLLSKTAHESKALEKNEISGYLTNAFNLIVALENDIDLKTLRSARNFVNQSLAMLKYDQSHIRIFSSLEQEEE